MLRCNGIKVPRSRNRFSLSLLDRRKMSKPCSQLNSKVIRDKAECHIIAAIEKKCSVVAFKCVWRVHDDESNEPGVGSAKRETSAILLCPK